MKKFTYFLALAFLLLASSAARAQNPDAILGKWLNGDKDAHVEIYKGDGGKYFGKIVWLKEPVYPANDEGGMAGKTKVDRKNPDVNKRTQPILGLVVLRNYEYVKGSNPPKWENGLAYDPKKGKDYKSKMTLVDPANLDVRGFVGFSLLGVTQKWTRVKEGTM